MHLFKSILVLIAFASLSQLQVAHAQLEFENAPINYSDTEANDPISQLQAELDAGERELVWENKNGYLAAVLEHLKIPQSSQMLVFSKTSLQLRRITPQKPRAIYFNDDTYIGWVQDGDVIEISTVDPQLGGVFYTLSTEQSLKPRFVRDQGQCLTCHASSRTQGVPGHLMRSVFVDRSGQPHYGSGTFSTTQSSPFEKRWGGWYVTGTYGELRHMGNTISPKNIRSDELDREPGANLTDLKDLVDTSPYLQPTSDVVPLMVLAHQVEMHNLLARGNFEARQAQHYDGVMNKALERDADFISDSTQRRVASIGEKIVRCLLYSDETPLNSTVKGVSNYAGEFQKQGPFDEQGRSLRDFDLQQRLFRYPCSYLIYSDAFDGLPAIVKEYVSGRLFTILNDTAGEDEFPHLSSSDRSHILAILKETKPELFNNVAVAD